MDKAALVSDLVDLFGEEDVLVEADQLIKITPEFLYGDHAPIALVRPSEMRQLNRLLMIMKRHHVSGITPRGFGRSFGAYSRHIIVDLSKINEILEIDESRKVVIVQAGISYKKFSSEMEKHNLRLPLSPFKAGTLGGFIAFESLRIGSYKYGNLDGYLRGVTLFTSKRLVKLGTKNTPPYAAGYNLTNLLIGSMGFYGIIIDATLGLLPTPELHHDISITLNRTEDLFQILDFLKSLEALSNLTVLLSKERMELLISLEGFKELVELDIEKIHDLTDVEIKGLEHQYINEHLEHLLDNRTFSEPLIITYHELKKIFPELKDGSVIAHFLSPDNCMITAFGPKDDRDIKYLIEKCAKNAYFSKENLFLIKKVKKLFDPNNYFQPGLMD